MKNFKTLFRTDKRHSSTWRKNAREWFDFYSGEQWDPEDVTELKEKLRPVITFNRTAIVVNAVAGSEIQNKPEMIFSPVEQGDVMPNNMLQAAGVWFRETADSDFADTEAFLHTCICGMGWTETRIDYEEDVKGEPSDQTIDPLEMYWDASARKPGLVDATRLWRAVRMTKGAAKEKFPTAPVSKLHAGWAQIDVKDDQEAKDQDRANEYQDDDTNSNDDTDNDDAMVTIIHCQYVEKTPMIYIEDPTTKKGEFLDPKSFKTLNERMVMMGQQPLSGVELPRKRWMQCFYGEEMLGEPVELPTRGYGWKCITGYKHHTKGTWYGLIKAMKDPQMWANKWLSQTLHILNSNAKGGVAVEKTAVEDIRQFEQSWAKQDEITWLNPGGKDKIMPKVSSSPSASFFNLMEFAITSIRDAAGVNLEQMGMRGAIQASSLEEQRKKAGQAIVAPLLESLHQFRKNKGRMTIEFIQKYLNDGRLIRIVGEGNIQYVPLAIQQDMKYDVIIDEGMGGPAMKDKVWSFIAPIMDRIPPNVLIELLPFSPLPGTVVSAVQNALRQASQPDPIDAEMKKAELQKLVADAGMTQASTQKTLAEAKKTHIDALDVISKSGETGESNEPTY